MGIYAGNGDSHSRPGAWHLHNRADGDDQPIRHPARSSTTQRTARTPPLPPRNTAGPSPFPRPKPSWPSLRPVVTVNSAVTSGTYTIQSPAATPAFSPAGGTYATAQMVAISDATPGASIYYTTDGTNPTTSSSKYSGPITVSSTQTIKAIAAASDFSNSAVASGLYTIQPPAATPAFSPAGGTYTTTQMVTMSDATPGASIYYTTDGTNPTPSSSKYTGPITVSSTQTVNAIAAANGYSNSAVGSAAYVIQPPPTFAFSGSPGSLTIASGGEGTVTLTVTPQNGFYGAVSFACTGLPSSVGCTFSPTTVTPSGTSAVTTQLTFAATTATGSLRGNPVRCLPGCIAGPRCRFSLARKAAQGVVGFAAGSVICGSGNAYGLRRRIVHSTADSECAGDVHRYRERHFGLYPAVRHSDTHGELETHEGKAGDIHDRDKA